MKVGDLMEALKRFDPEEDISIDFDGADGVIAKVEGVGEDEGIVAYVLIWVEPAAE